MGLIESLIEKSILDALIVIAFTNFIIFIAKSKLKRRRRRKCWIIVTMLNEA